VCARRRLRRDEVWQFVVVVVRLALLEPLRVALVHEPTGLVRGGVCLLLLPGRRELARSHEH